ncbi:hypothetical protein SESBI_51329 [Sesbania bispinosa]|nr:hypothetical protein SESBI_51329 [Sesbania bispinosa]
MGLENGIVRAKLFKRKRGFATHCTAPLKFFAFSVIKKKEEIYALREEEDVSYRAALEVDQICFL